MSDGRAGPGQATGPAAGAVRVAAIDCGTNSLRLLVADIDPREATLADQVRRMEIVRLGQGVDATGRLAPDALARTFGVLEEYARIISGASASAVRMVATSATRDAANSAAFVSGVTRIIGKQPEVLSGDEEALLSYIGATAELARPAPGQDRLAADQLAPPYLVIDIGGGSTEFVLGGGSAEFVPGGGSAEFALGGGSAEFAPGRGQAGRFRLAGAATGGSAADAALAAMSVDIGCVRMTERHLRSDPPTGAEIAAATADIDAAIAEVAGRIPVQRARTLVGLAGSVTTVAGIALGLPGLRCQPYPPCQDPGRRGARRGSLAARPDPCPAQPDRRHASWAGGRDRRWRACTRPDRGHPRLC